jgi:hypothetical protein
MSPEAIQRLLDEWRVAERGMDGHEHGSPSYLAATEAVARARRAYVDAVTERARLYGYASGTRTVQSDIRLLQEAEDRRSAAEPNSASYHEAAFDVQERALRIVAQVAEDEALQERD